jgi:hypothetical protein
LKGKKQIQKFPEVRLAGSIFRTDSIRQDVDMVTARINYRFGGPAVGRY